MFRTMLTCAAIALGIALAVATAAAETPRTPYYVAMGDSFSSGEGACSPQTAINCSYIAPTNTKANHCHRSQHAYGPGIANLLGSEWGFAFVACSGAVVDDFYKVNHSNSSERPQLEMLKQLDTPTTEVKLVTLTVGGNDQEFAAVLKECMVRNANFLWRGCRKAVKQAVPDGEFVARLAGIYMAVHDDAPSARVLVLGYPHLFHKPAKGFCLLRWADANWVHDQIDHIDQLISRAVNAADKSAGRSFAEFVSEAHAFDGHELCRGERGSEYLNGLVLKPSPHTRESFHPNILGQRQFIESLKAVL